MDSRIIISRLRAVAISQVFKKKEKKLSIPKFFELIIKLNIK